MNCLKYCFPLFYPQSGSFKVTNIFTNTINQKHSSFIKVFGIVELTGSKAIYGFSSKSLSYKSGIFEI